MKITAWAGGIVALLVLTAPRGASADALHTFRYVPPPADHPQHVDLAGDFNNWSQSAMPMELKGDAFTLTISLPEGVHFYKFVVDGRWVADPNDDKSLEIDDTFGGKNSAVLIGVDARHAPFPQADEINLKYVLHDPSQTEDANAAGQSLVRFRIRTLANDARHVYLHYGNPWLPTWPRIELDKMSTQLGLDIYGGVLQVPPQILRGEQSFSYYFELEKHSVTLNVASGKSYPDAAAAQAGAMTMSVQPSFQTPDWAKHAIWYQIFPERFRNGDPSNDPPGSLPWTSNWNALQTGEHGNVYQNIYNRRYGGDIQGIEQELPYLRELGVNAIYLNPVFEAASLHKYDATDYRHIDEHFGSLGDIEQIKGETDDPATWQWTKSDKIFLDFVADAHRQGFHVIIDGVFNHVGRPFWAFVDVMKHGRTSKYAGWFDIIDWNPARNAPFHYHAWDGDNGALPVFKKDPVLGIVHGPREHIFAIARRWLAPDGDVKRGVDGFRLDAPENVPHPFWVDFRKVVKSINPDAYIDGEIWSWAQSYLKGDQYDAVMNYQFAIPCQQFFVDQKNAISPTAFNRDCDLMLFNYPYQVVLDMQNLLDSHDTDRVASMFANPDIGFNSHARLQDSGPNYNIAPPTEIQRRRMLQEVAFQMTFVGAPMIYYGDEAGMWGASDPADRQPMIWKDLEPYDDPNVRFDQGKFDWYRRMIAVRKSFEAVQTGFFHPLLLNDAEGIFAFSRDLNERRVYVVLNRGDTPRHAEFPVDTHDGKLKIVEDSSFDQFTNGFVSAPDGKVNLRLDAWGVIILTAAN